MSQELGDGPGGAVEKEGLRLGGGAIASIVGVALMAIFMVQNTDDVAVDFLFWSFTWPLWLFGLVMAVFGALVWLGFGIVRRHRRRKERRADRRG